MFSTSNISSVITSVAIIMSAFVFLMCTYANWGEDSFVIGIVLIVVYAIVHLSAVVYHAYSDAIHSIAWKANEAFIELDRVSSILPPFATEKERNFVVLLFLSFISTFSYLIDLQYGYYMYAVPQLFAIFLYVVTVTFSTKYVVALEGLMFIVSQRLTSILPYVTHWNDSRLENLAKFTIWDLTPIIFTSATVANIYTILLVIFILRRIRLLSRVRFIIVYPMMMFLREIIVLVTLIPCRVTVDTCSDNMFSGHVFTIVYLSLGLRNSFCVWVPYVAYFSLTGFHYTSDILVAIILAFLVHSHKFAMIERYLSIMFGQVWELDFHVDCICNICYWDKVESGQLITDCSQDGDDHSPHLVALEQEQFAYKEFRTRHPEDKVSFTSFVKHTLRPLMRYERLDNLYDCTGNVVARFSYPYNSKLDGVYHGREGNFNRKLYDKAYVPKGNQIKGVALIEVTVDDEQLQVSESSSGEELESSSLSSNSASENVLFE